MQSIEDVPSWLTRQKERHVAGKFRSFSEFPPFGFGLPHHIYQQQQLSSLGSQLCGNLLPANVRSSRSRGRHAGQHVKKCGFSRSIVAFKERTCRILRILERILDIFKEYGTQNGGDFVRIDLHADALDSVHRLFSHGSESFFEVDNDYSFVAFQLIRNAFDVRAFEYGIVNWGSCSRHAFINFTPESKISFTI